MNIIETVKAWAKSMDKDDVRFLAMTLVSVALWYVFAARPRYSTKGMR